MALPSSSQSMNPIANAPPMDFAEKKGREAAVGGKRGTTGSIWNETGILAGMLIFRGSEGACAELNPAKTAPTSQVLPFDYGKDNSFHQSSPTEPGRISLGIGGKAHV
jgi:hypothetical protein